jgi:ketosteroid isomerase-like protein
MMDRPRVAVPCLLLLCLTPSCASGQSPADSIRSLDSAWARAYAVHDTGLAGSLFADDLVVTGLNGTLKDKEAELADVRPLPNLHMEFFRTRDVAVRVYGRSAVVTGLAEWRFTLDGSANEFRRRYTSVFVAGGPLGWRMVALHLGRAP